MNSVKKCKTLYILGHSRSGSTILNILLGNISSVFAAGEINNYLKSGWVNDHYCSCGNLVSQCEFWPKVRESLGEYVQPDAEGLIQSAHRLEIWRNLYKSKLGTTEDQNYEMQNYMRFNSELIKSIARFSNSNWVVDASKSPMRLINLISADDLDVSTIHIVRDPRGVCWSLMKSASKNVEAGIQVDLPSTPYLVTVKNLYINAFMSLLAKRKLPSKSVTLRYEDLINSPSEAIQKIGALMGVDISELKKITDSNQQLQQYHNVAGNRLRMKSNITLKLDESWKINLSRSQYLTITALTLPLLLIYRFPIKRSP